jgi:hypothetical protein
VVQNGHGFTGCSDFLYHGHALGLQGRHRDRFHTLSVRDRYSHCNRQSSSTLYSKVLPWDRGWQQLCARHKPSSAVGHPEDAYPPVCAWPWEVARCVLPEGTRPQACSGCTPRRQCPVGGAPRRPRRARGACRARVAGPAGPVVCSRRRARCDVAGPHGGRRAAEVRSPPGQDV